MWAFGAGPLFCDDAAYLEFDRVFLDDREMKLCRTMAWLGCSLVVVSGCATVTRGPNVDVKVATEPPGAVVTTDLLTVTSRNKKRRLELDGVEVTDDFAGEYVQCAPTPCEIRVSRRSNFELTVTKPGFHPATVQLSSGYGRGGAVSGAGGAAVSATGAYIVSYAAISALLPTLTYVATFGLASSAATSAAATSAAASGAATAAAGIGALFLGVDWATGAMRTVRPNPVILILIPSDQDLPEGPIPLVEDEAELAAILERIKD